jgi:hypothetical protein
MFLAAFRSRSMTSPQVLQTCVRTRKDLWIRLPQPEQSCDVYAGGTASTRLPAHAAVYTRRDRRWRHPASRMLVLRPALWLAPLCAEPPVPVPFSSGFGSGRRLTFAAAMASTEIVGCDSTRNAPGRAPAPVRARASAAAAPGRSCRTSCGPFVLPSVGACVRLPTAQHEHGSPPGRLAQAQATPRPPHRRGARPTACGGFFLPPRSIGAEKPATKRASTHCDRMAPG